MRQFVLPEGVVSSLREGRGVARLVGADFRYLCRVLRLRTGAVFEAVDREVRRYRVELRLIGADFCELSVAPAAGAEPTAPGREAPRIALFQCVPKGRRLETIVRQATEAGVELVVPVLSEHCVATAEGETRIDRLERVAREAMQQSGSQVVTRVHVPAPFASIPSLWSDFRRDGRGVPIFFHQEPLAHSSLHQYLSSEPDAVAVVIGPEGGLSASETSSLSQAGFLPVYLGANILRTETAALYAIAAVKTIAFERASWQIDRKTVANPSE